MEFTTNYREGTETTQSKVLMLDLVSAGSITPVPDSIILTREELTALLEETWEAAINYDYTNQFGRLPNKFPSFQTFISNKLKS